jgi:hypothetical protein
MDRFELEQQISGILNVCDDLNLLTENILENDMDTDEVANALIGISIVLKMKHDKIFDVFKQTFKLDQYKESNVESFAKY